MSEKRYRGGAPSKQSKAGATHRVKKVTKPAARPIPGIEKTPGVCGGDPCIRQRRIPVWLLERSRQLGMTEAEILADYPTLLAQDLVNAWAYVRAHRDEIEQQILRNESA